MHGGAFLVFAAQNQIDIVDWACTCVNEDINDAITGHSGGNAVARGYGWKDMVRRFGFSTLSEAVEKVRYPGLDLSAIRWTKARSASPSKAAYATFARSSE
jgi:hypothetical protein